MTVKEFFSLFITTAWGIAVLCALCVFVWFLLSVLLYRPIFKRLYDILLSLTAILVFSPLILFFTILGAIIMRGNPFFVQKRPGKIRGKDKQEKIFKLIKFRTMTNRKDADGNLLPDEKRLTSYGKILRALSIDELPQLFNIFIGDMSIIGPRPLLVSYLSLYDENERRRHKVRPGLTGLAQVSGRNAISWEQKFDKDTEYVARLSFLLDLKIFFKTIGKVFKRSGISQEGEATMSVFTGTKNRSILILSAGRRVELVKAFTEAKNRLKIKGNVVAADMLTTAPALYFADVKAIIPAVSDAGYLDALMQVVKENKISLIIPTIDTELEFLLLNKAAIEQSGAKVLVSDCASLCFNKADFNAFLEREGLDAPKTYSLDEALANDKFPLFIKPAKGSSSVNAYKINNKEELSFFAGYIQEPVIQEFVSGTEYTIDILCDFESNPLYIVPRVRLAVRSGEILKGMTDKNEAVIKAVKTLIAKLKPIGQITAQGILDKDGDFKFLEVNPRFGGGAPMSIKAGADIPGAIYKMLNGDKLSFKDDWESNKTIVRFDDSIVI